MKESYYKLLQLIHKQMNTYDWIKYANKNRIPINPYDGSPIFPLRKE